MDGGNGAKTIVYNTKRNSKKGERRKNTRKKKRKKGGRNTTVKRKSSSLSIILTGHVGGCFLHVCMCDSFHFNTIYQYLYPRFRLVFFPTLYKFIVRAFWAWVHSCSEFKSKLVLTAGFLIFAKHFALTSCPFNMINFTNLFYYSAYFCYYSWVTLHFLVLFMSSILLFN